MGDLNPATVTEWSRTLRSAGGRERRSGARPTRLSDVARRAGVSVKTVSNVVNGYVHVSPDTRAKVDRALAELDYRPNLAARNLRQGRSGIVALAVPDLDVPYFAEVAGAPRPGRAAAGLDRPDRPDRRRPRPGALAIENFGTRLVDGLILSPLASGVPELAGAPRDDPDGAARRAGLRRAGRPRLHRQRRGCAATPCGTCWTWAAAGSPRSASSPRVRRDRPAAAARLPGGAAPHGLPADPDLVVTTAGIHPCRGSAAVDRLLALDRAADAIFCFNDLLALGALRRLHERGIRVPGDVAVVGFDDIEDGRYSVPTLTTVRPDKERIAELAVDLLAERIEAQHAGGPVGGVAAGSAGREVTAPYDLVVRESTSGAAPSGQLA